ncbi:MAG TPA: MurT ligase domain-containing protein [Solirubrobacteraceae bacterium]|nr:MurT ligase domain-containing protein [Solirubrobacteraceae bacterium]
MAAIAVKAALARAAGRAVRASGRGGGTSLPGRLLLRWEPGAIGTLAARLPAGSAIISATNGKTTTAAMVASILERSGVSLVHNRSGANMAGGIASTLLDALQGRGIAGEMGLFEVDEFWLATLVSELAPRALLLANLFRDQLDRYGELDTIADRWAEVVGAAAPGTRLVLNADDPLVADLGRERHSDAIRPDVLYFGLELDAGLGELEHASDSTHCRRCGSPYTYSAVHLGHLGRYRCPGCGRTRPEPTIRAAGIELLGTRGAHFRLETPEGSAAVRLGLPGLYNVYNAVGAAALAHGLGVGLDTIVAGLEATAAAFGRGERVAIGAVDLQLLLIKNPAGANEVLRTLALESADLHLLGVLNDRIADGRDVSWIWDADWELLAPHIGRAVCAGTRAAELALRLKYAGVPTDRLAVVPELPRALDAALAPLAGGSPAGSGRSQLFAVPTYTAMLALREELAARGHVDAFWQERA